MNLSVCMILGKCDEKLVNTLNSVAPIADEICLVQTVEDDSTLDLVNKFMVNSEKNPIKIKYNIDTSLMHEDGYLRSFSQARNKSFEMATGDMILWVDSDDTLSNPLALREFIDNAYENGIEGIQVDRITMDYDYEFNDYGLCTTRHRRERVVRNGYFKWIAPIHEGVRPFT